MVSVLSAPASAAPAQPKIDLGSAAAYSVLSFAAITNGGASIYPGNVGVHPGIAITGIAAAKVGGTIDAGNATAAKAQADLTAAIHTASSLAPTATISGDLAGRVITPGVYKAGAALGMTTTLTFDAQGNPDAVFVFQVGAALNTTASSTMTLVGGAQASNIYWVVAAASTLGASSSFVGTIMGGAAITVGAGTRVDGRALTNGGAVTLSTNSFGSVTPAKAPVVTINGGPQQLTATATPKVSGTSDTGEGSLVTILVDGVASTTTVAANGTWTFSPSALTDGAHTISVSAIRAGISSSASQTLTIDTSAPVVTITGGNSSTTAAPSPTVSGTSDGPAGTVVTVTVDGVPQTATTTSAGTWSIPAVPLADGEHTITASVTNTAGTTTTVTQTLTSDTLAPTLTITGGDTALSNTATPVVSGTTDATSGTTVSVNIDGQPVRTTTVTSSGTWSLTSGTLVDGPRTITVTVADAAGNTTTVKQTLTIDTESPALTITGGTTAAGTSAKPTIAGTSDAATGTVITLTIDGAGRTVTVTADGTWSYTGATLSDGAHTITASVADPAGNTTTATQTLTITTVVTPAPVPLAITITGGSTATGTDSTPTITGTSTAAAGTVVTVTVAGQKLTATVASNGSWSATTAKITDGSYALLATVTVGTASATAKQNLTIDTQAFALTITGGATVITRDNTPTIAGTSNAPAGTRIVVAVNGKDLTTKVKADGTWKLTAPKLTDGDYAITATVADAAGNVRTVRQALTIDTVAPTVTINGGAAASVSNTSPTITGTATSGYGTTVTITVAGQKLTTTVVDNGVWAVTTGTLKNGTHTVKVSTKDAAGNTGSAQQKLTVKKAALPPTTPGGSTPVEGTWAVGYNDQVIQGTSTAAVGTKVIVTVSKQVLTTSVQEGGLWGIRLNKLPSGTYDLQVEARTSATITDTAHVRLVIKTSSAPAGEPEVTFGCAEVSPNGEAKLSFGGKTLTASIHEYGVWSMEPAKAADCKYVVVASMADKSGDTGMYSRVLKSANTAPTVTISGGASATANPAIRTIAGTSDAAAGSTVRMRMSGQTLVTKVRADGTWSFFRNSFSSGTHQLVVSVVDAKDGTGYAIQALTFLQDK